MADVRLRDLNPAEFNYGVNVAGYLGVGTTSPAYDLHVKPGTGNADFVLEKASAVSILVQANSTIGKIGTQTNNDVQFITNNSTKMTLENGGNVGIGTTSPNEILEVKSSGTTRIRLDSADSGASSLDLHDNGSLGARINCDSAKNLELMAGGRTGGDLKILASNGHVGIGESSPANFLHVNSGGTGTVAQFKSTSTTAKIMFNNSGGNANFIGGHNDKLLFQTNSTNRMVILNGGNVGIGTTNPVAHLTVGDGTGSETISINKSTSGSATLSFLNAGSTKVYLQADSNEHLRIATNNAVHMSILENGNVGIGHTSPTAKLHVDGDLIVTGTVDVGSSGFSVSSGFILPFGGGTLPSGWLECDGAAVSRSTYSDLFAIIGTTYGAGDGSTTFNLPDLQGRVIMGQGGSNANRTPADLENIGDTFGSQNHSLQVSELPSHNHAATTTYNPVNGSSRNDNTSSAINATGRRTRFGGISFKTTISNTGANEAHNNIQPSIVINYLIKT